MCVYIGVKVFTVAELKKATNDFGKEMVIDESYGGVFRGCINPNTLSPAKEGLGIAVAVKICYLPDQQALQQWLVSHYDLLTKTDSYINSSSKKIRAEILLVDLEFLRLNSHPSVVKLIGYGSDRDTLFIVSEYFPNGSLERHIYRGKEVKTLYSIKFHGLLIQNQLTASRLILTLIYYRSKCHWDFSHISISFWPYWFV